MLGLSRRLKLLADHLDLRRGFETELDDTALDGEELYGEAQGGEANSLIPTASKNEHGRAPFRDGACRAAV
jgi:hypothetical protein